MLDRSARYQHWFNYGRPNTYKGGRTPWASFARTVRSSAPRPSTSRPCFSRPYLQTPQETKGGIVRIARPLHIAMASFVEAPIVVDRSRFGLRTTMPDTTVRVLKDEIARLEKLLNRYRRALQVLEGRDASERGSNRIAQRPKKVRKRTTRKRPSSAAMKRSSGRRGSQPPKLARRRGETSTGALIEKVLSARAPRLLTPAEIVWELSQQGEEVDPRNVHRRVSDLVKKKAITRREGRYGMP